MVTWKLREYLDAHKVSAYALTKIADLAPNTVYALARGDQGRLDLVVLDKVISGLEQLTGQTVTFNDLLERGTQNDGAVADESEYEFPDGVPDDIRERIEQFEQSDKKGRPLREIAAKYGVER